MAGSLFENMMSKLFVLCIDQIVEDDDDAQQVVQSSRISKSRNSLEPRHFISLMG